MTDRAVGIDSIGAKVVDLRDGEVSLRDAEIYFRERSFYESFVKPTLDFVGALILVLILSPVMIASAIAVYFSLGNPVILKQPRVGRGGRVFEVYKFRTMKPDRRSCREPFDGLERRISHKRPDDPRLTPTGVFLRKWSLDELPQFLNVLKGDMSLVGPRPEMVQLVAAYEPWQHQRHAVKPGITCTWQISARGDQMLHEATGLDLEYIEHLSLLTDTSILIRTPLAILGARPGS